MTRAKYLDQALAVGTRVRINDQAERDQVEVGDEGTIVGYWMPQWPEFHTDQTMVFDVAYPYQVRIEGKVSASKFGHFLFGAHEFDVIGEVASTVTA